MNRVCIYLLFSISFGACDYSFNRGCSEKPYLEKFTDTLWYPAIQDRLTFLIKDTSGSDTLFLEQRLKVFDIFSIADYGCNLYYESLRCEFHNENEGVELIYEYSQKEPKLRITLDIDEQYIYNSTVINGFKNLKSSEYYYHIDNRGESTAIHVDSGLVNFSDEHVTLKLIR
ncbi:MAG: hypothetical protein ACPGLV_03920 [Bacteroidia bacterium]